MTGATNPNWAPLNLKSRLFTAICTWSGSMPQGDGPYIKMSSYKTGDDEERKGLLSNVDDPEYLPPEKSAETERTWSRKTIVVVAVSLILLILCGSFARSLLIGKPQRAYSESNQHFGGPGQILRSNGTHDYKRTVLIVSIDGLRCDVLVACSNSS